MPAYGVLLFMFLVLYWMDWVGLLLSLSTYIRRGGWWGCLVTIIGFMHSCALVWETNRFFLLVFLCFSGLVTPKTGIPSFLSKKYIQMAWSDGQE